MKPLRKLTISLAAAAFALSLPVSAQVSDHREIKTPALRDFKVQQPTRIELPNGMVIFLQPDRELPLINGTAVIRGGSREVPADRTGLIGVYGQVWRTGGTATRTGDELDDFLEARAAKVETGGDDDSTRISFDTMKGSFEETFTAFLDLLRNPSFREEKIGLAKNQLNTAISRRNDEMGSIAAREGAKLVYGADSPYARQPEYATVAAITRDDLVAWHKRYVHPNNIILGIAGDFDAKQMEARLRKAFASWQRGPQAPKPEVAINPAPAGVYYVEKDDVTQANIRLLHLGTTRNNPDYHAIQVMNEIFGGGFSGRLMNRIRSEKGLAYSVGGGVGTSFDRPGMFQVSMGTKSGSTLEAINALHAEIEAIQKGPIETDELALAKESILNSFIFLRDTRRKVLSQRMSLEFYGYPADFYERYRTGVEKITAEDVLRVANKYIKPGEITLLVVGRQQDFDQPLSTLGEVRTIDITIPQPGSSAAPVTGNDEGAALLSQVRSFVAGEQNVDDIRSVRTVTALNVSTPQGDMALEQESLVVFPDRLRQTTRLPMGEMTMVATGDSAFAITPMGVRDLPGSQRDAIAGEIRQDLIHLLRNAGQPGYAFQAGATETIGGVSARALEIDAAGAKFTLWVDPATGRVLRKVSMSAAMGAPAEQVTDYTDWQTAGGYRFPKSFTITSGGQPAGSAEVKSAEVNVAVDDSMFARPE
jgi:zinc protease